MGRNWELGYETARRAAALYPERVESWSSLLFYEKNVLGESYLDSTLAGHRARLQAFHKRLASRTTLSDNVPGDMFWYARGVGDSALASYWQRRLETETPRSPFAAQNRAGAIWSRLWHDKDSLRALADMDRLWDDVGPAHGNLVNLGWRVAQIAGGGGGGGADAAGRAGGPAWGAGPPPGGGGRVAPTRRFVGTAVDTASWHRALEDGRLEMRRRVLDGATRRPLRAGVRLEGTGGRLVRFDSVAQGRVTFVAFWSRHCGPSLDELPALNRMAARLKRDGIGVVTITDERVSEELQRFLAAKGLSLPVYADARRGASRAFSQWGTPSYHVLDASGQIRFSYRELGRSLSEVAALR